MTSHPSTHGVNGWRRETALRNEKMPLNEGQGKVVARSLEEVKAATSIVQVVGRYVELRPTSAAGGTEYRGCCPFHDDSNPSMGVSEDKGLYHCFSCHASGDVIGFVKDIEGISFRESVEKVAEISGIELELADGPLKDNSRWVRRSSMILLRSEIRPAIKTAPLLVLYW